MTVPSAKKRFKNANAGQEPLVVQMGMARWQRKGGRIEYQWDQIFALWQDYPEAALERFARMYGIGWSAISKRPEFNRKDKIMQLRRNPRGDFVKHIQHTLHVLRTNDATENEQLRSILEQLYEAVQAQAILLRSRMVKEQPDGTSVANVSLSNAQLRSLSDTAKNIAGVLKELTFLSAAIPNDKEDEGVTPEPSLRIVDARNRKVS